jgi:hypothetical protein
MTSVEQEQFAFFCELEGFDLPAFDAWLSDLEPGDAKAEFVRRRAEALAAAKQGRTDLAVRHLEYLHVSAWAMRRFNAMAPVLRAERARQDGLAKHRHVAPTKITSADIDRYEPQSVNDKHLAKLLGVHPGTLSNARKRLNRPRTIS